MLFVLKLGGRNRTLWYPAAHFSDVKVSGTLGTCDYNLAFLFHRQSITCTHQPWVIFINAGVERKQRWKKFWLAECLMRSTNAAAVESLCVRITWVSLLVLWEKQFAGIEGS